MGSFQKWRTRVNHWLKRQWDSTSPQAIGRRAEQAACRYLKQQHCRLLCQNYRGPKGEIDLIMEDGDCLVFIEVRYRRNNDFGTPLESVDKPKQQRIIKTARYFLQRNPTLGYENRRFDVVSIQQLPAKPESCFPSTIAYAAKPHQRRPKGENRDFPL